MTISIEQAQIQLAELVKRSRQGEEVVITEGGQSVARLVPDTPGAIVPRIGFAKGKLRIISDDDEHLKDFAEYM